MTAAVGSQSRATEELPAGLELQLEHLRKQLEDALANLLSCNESLKVARHGC